MSLPNVILSFTDAAKTIRNRYNRGVVGMIIKDVAATKNPAYIQTKDDIPATYSAASQAAINLALIGNSQSPKEIVVYAVGADAEDYSAALSAFSAIKIDYLCAPTCNTDGQVDAIKAWVLDQRQSNKSIVTAVLPNCAGDNEGIVNWATASCTASGTEYKAETYTARIAGILASTPISQSATYVTLPELTGCTTLSRTELNKADESGQFICFFDGEKVKTGRAVNSLQTTSKTKGDQWKKIRVVRIMDIIRYDIANLVEDDYIGHYSNSYDNKCILLSAIKQYFNDLVKQTALDSAEVELNVTAIKKYLDEQRVDTSTMSDSEIKQHSTGSWVFMKATIGILDAMEDIELDITI